MKILVVDDSVTSRALFAALIPKGQGIQLYEAGDMETAVNQAKSINPDLCVMDYNLPGTTGIDVAEEIVKIGVESKFVLMTSDTKESIINRARQFGFITLIKKPIDSEKVNEILDFIQQLNNEAN